MSDDVRYQRKCYYASSDYSESFWGKFVYIYQGTGGLRLTTKAIALEGCPGAVTIPFEDVDDIQISRFSPWAKPMGLSRLSVAYTHAGESKLIHLVPHESLLDPTAVTSEIVASWFETLRGVAKLSHRVRPSQLDPVPSNPYGKGFAVAALLLPLAIAAWVWFS